MLTIEKISCLRNQNTLFTHLDFSVAPGEILHITGANGAGKSSLLQILVGLLLPQAGCVYWNGVPIGAKDADYRQHMCYLSHKIGVKLDLTVLENLYMASQLAGQSHTQMELLAILKYFNLEELGTTLCQKLSAGQRQRVALSRFLFTQAQLWVLDEPFTSLDARSSAALQALLEKHLAKGGIVILTGHHVFRCASGAPKLLELN